MIVWVNGERHALAEDATVADALAALGLPQRGVAVAVDGQVVPRAGWAGRRLGEGEQVEVLTAVQGG